MEFLGTTISDPQFRPVTAWLEHGPFATWLVRRLKPRRIVELGTHFGYSYFAMCQSVAEAGLSTECIAIDLWQGDEHAGFYDNSVYESVVAENEQYKHFSRLIRSKFADALALVEDGSIDLLHIDGTHLYDDVREDFESWRPKLSPSAVVLFHDTEVRERDFGLYRYWPEVSAGKPTWNFRHEHGLGVLFWGDDLPEGAADLVRIAGDDLAREAALACFAGVGLALRTRHEAALPEGAFQAQLGEARAQTAPDTLADREIALRCNAGVATIATLIDHYKVISFDVFDTLLTRRVAEPVDVFRLVEAHRGFDDFVAARIKAEHLARRRFGSGKSPEVTLDEIYTVLADLRPDLTLSAQDELDAEAEMLFADSTVAQIVAMARERGKRVIAVSDMYLNGAQIAALLEGAGVSVDRVYSSADHRDAGLGKFNTRMYGFVAGEEGVAPSEILHFGDNGVADFLNALEAGVPAIHMRSRRDCLAKSGALFAPPAMADGTLTSALVRGQVLARLPQFQHGASNIYAYGYAVAGPLILGFCRFLAARAAEDGIERLVLAARDGYIIQKALDILKLDLPNYSVMPLSRRMAIFPTLTKDAPFVEKVIFSELRGPATPRDYWTQLHLDVADLGDAVQIESPIGEKEFVRTYYAQLEQAAEAERARLVRHLEAWMGTRSALVDVGWGLSSVRAIDKIRESDFPGYFVGIHGQAYRRPGMHGYLFEYGQSPEVELPLMRVAEIIELVFSDQRPSVSVLQEVSGEIEPVQTELPASEVARASAIYEVQAGVLCFLRDIKDIHHLMEDRDLREFNRQAFVRLATEPTIEEYETLASIPHSRGVGHTKWNRISDFWHVPKPVQREEGGNAARFSEAERLLQRFNLIAPHSVKKLVGLRDLEKHNLWQEFLRNPLNVSHWMALLRYRYRMRRRARQRG
jgi:predicted HAD superfamily hydrolase